MRKIMMSVFGAGLLLNLGVAKADFPPACPSISTMINNITALTQVYGPSKRGNWYYYFQREVMGTIYQQVTYYNLGAPVSDPVHQLKLMEAALGEPKVVDIQSATHPETNARECIYVGNMDAQGNPLDEGGWQQVITLRFSQYALLNLHIDTGPDLPPGSVNITPYLINIFDGIEFFNEITSGRDQEFGTLFYSGYKLLVNTVIQTGGHTYQLTLNNPYVIDPELLENGDTLLLNYKRVS